MEPLVSIIINKYKYARFLPAAIESALAQDLAGVEVIVVDDGSTDDSREVIERFRSDVRAVLKDNGGQASTFNAGVATSRGKIVMFLDSDDYLYPVAASRVVEACSDDCSKVQFPLSIVDEHGVRHGADPSPGTPMPTAEVVTQLLERGRYVTPVTSGNAHRRAVLEQVTPVPELEFRFGADGSRRLLPNADSRAAAREGRARHLPGQVHLARRSGARAVTGSKPSAADGQHVLPRLALLRLNGGSDLTAGDSRWQLVRAGTYAIRHDPSLPAVEKLMPGALLVGIGALPRSLARRIANWALISRPRPRVLKLAVRALRRILGR